MKHKYLFIIEFEGETVDNIKPKCPENAVKEFYQEILKDQKGVLTFFRNIVYSQMLDGDNIYGSKFNLEKNLVKEIKLIEPVLEKLPEKSKEEIIKIIDDEEKRDIFWEDFFELFGKLKVEKMNFMLSEPEKK